MLPERKASPPRRVTSGNAPRGAQAASAPAKVVGIDRDSGLVWRGPEYSTLEPGVYTVRAVKVQGPDWVRAYQRWSVRIEFAMVHEPVSVSAFFNLGNDPNKQNVGRMSRYYRAWVIANGEHPRKGQRMGADVFMDGQFFEVEVEACNRDSDGKPKQDAEVYSRVTRILSAKRV